MKKPFYPLAALLILLASCSPIYYSPNTQNVNLFIEKNQFMATVASNSGMTEVQLAASASDNIAIQINGGIMKPKDLDNGNGGSGKFGELGVGYFKKLSGPLKFECYALAGFGAMENHLPSTVDTANSTTGKIEAGLMRIAIQPALGVKLGPVTIAASARLGSIQYNNIAGSLIYKNQNQVDYLTSNKSLFVAEPALTARFGTPIMQIQAQAGTSLNLTNSAFLQNTNYVSLGVVIKLEGAKN